jgi:hypothetical protein
LNEGNGVLLLFPWCVDIGKEQRDVMATDKRHVARIVVPLAAGFDISTCAGYVPVFALIDRFVGDNHLARFWRSFPCTIDSIADCINVCLGYVVLGYVKVRTVACFSKVPMVEIPIDTNVDIRISIIVDENIEKRDRKKN